MKISSVGVAVPFARQTRQSQYLLFAAVLWKRSNQVRVDGTRPARHV